MISMRLLAAPAGLLAFLALAPAIAQRNASRRETLAPPPTARDRRQKERQLHNELETPWHNWLETDVAYIISDEEKRGFSKLQTDDEREQFVEQFWLRRDGTPDTVENEFKEEHYRRIAYANEHFASGIPGWKADRGRIYITFGPPDEIDPHPSGGSYQRTAAEGGGQTSTYPFETWRYRYIERIGSDVNIEFVDRTMTGEYRLTIDPSEKDALLHVPGFAPGAPASGAAAGTDQFERLRQYTGLLTPPPVKFKDLQAVIESRIAYNVLPMLVRVDYMRVTDSSVLANITVQFENKDLEFSGSSGIQKALVNLQGRITSMTGRRINNFERAMEIPVPAELLPKLIGDRALYQESIPLMPGRYKLNLVAKDVVAGTLNSTEMALDVPRFEEGKLASGSLVLADMLEKLPTKSIGGAMFAVGDTKVRPRVGQKFRQGERMGIYLQLYNFSSDDVTHKPLGEVSYEVVKAGSNEKVLEFSQDVSAIPDASAYVATVAQWLPLKDLKPGRYALKVNAFDGKTKQTVRKEAGFSVE